MASNIGPTEHHAFYGDGEGAAAVATNLADGANCTAGSDHIYQSNFAYGADCTVMVTIALESGVTPAGYIFARYSGTTLQGIRYNGSTGLQLVVSNAVVRTIAVPSDGEIVVSWSMATDPLTPSRTRSEVRSWDSTLGGRDEDGVSWTHPAITGLAGSDIIWGAQVTSGTNSTGGELRGAGYLLHGTSSVQVHRDRVSASAAPTLTGETAMENPMPSWSSNFGAQDRPAGPTHYIAAQAVAANSLMLVSPLVNVQQEAPVPIPWSLMQATAWWALAPDGTSYMGLPWTWHRPVPQVADHVRCRIFIVAGADDPGAFTSSINVTVWSCNRNPGRDSPTPLVTYSVTETVSSAAATSPGVWLEFDDLRISRTPDGERTWLTVSIEADGVAADNLTVAFHAVTIDPLPIETTDAIGGIGNG